MKFQHKFTPCTENEGSFTYKCGDINARLDFVNSKALRVAVYKDGCKMLPTFNINPLNELSPMGRERLSVEGFEGYSPKVKSEGEETVFTLGDGIEIRLKLDNFLLSYFINGTPLFRDRAPLAYNLEKEFGEGVYHYISRAEGEQIYGLGDKSGELNKAGRAFRIETTDCMGYSAKTTDPLYKHIPFYICENSIGSYGIFYDTSATAYMDLGKEINNYYEPYKYYRSCEDCLVYYVFFGSKAEILRNYGSLCGKQAFPPKWSFDYCASTMAYTDAPRSEEKMNEFLEAMKNSGLDCSGFYLSSGYTSIGNGRYVFNWNRDKFPSPEKFIEHFSKNGIEIIPNIKPAFLTDHPMYGELKDRGLFVKNPDGTPFVTQFWDGLGSYLDFTNPEAFSFWQSKVKEALLDFGITATWNDNNEFDIKDTEALCCGFGENAKASLLRPALTYLMVLASHTAQLEKNPDLRPFLSTRSGGIGVRRLAQTWSGDNNTGFEDLKYCHRIGLTMSLSGLYFYGHDLGGFSGEMPSRELLLRWLQHGVFEPRMTVHSWNSDGSATMPFSYPDILESVRALFSQRKRLKPYLYCCAYNGVEKEIPLNAPPLLYYSDAELKADGNSMLVGRDILTAFVFDEGEENAEIFLPREDNWYLGDRLYNGGQWLSVKISPYSQVPFFVRQGSIIPYDENGLVFTVYPKAEGEFEAEFFDDDGYSFAYRSNDCVKLKFKVLCEKERVTVAYESLGNKKITPKIRLCDADSRILEVM